MKNWMRVVDGVNFMKNEIEENNGMINLETVKEILPKKEKETILKTMIEDGYKEIGINLGDRYVRTLCKPGLGFIEAYKMAKAGAV